MENSIIPALLVDGHVSHFDIEFLEYICDENNTWTVVFWCSLWKIIVAGRNTI